MTIKRVLLTKIVRVVFVRELKNVQVQDTEMLNMMNQYHLFLVPTCTDGVKNGIEDGVDCGGPCSRRCDGQYCLVDRECQNGYCAGYWSSSCQSIFRIDSMNIRPTNDENSCSTDLH